MKAAIAVAALFALAACDRPSVAEPDVAAAPAAVKAQPLTPSPEADIPVKVGQSPTVASAGEELTSGLCAPNEAVLAACQLREGRMLSVCGARDETGAEFAQYRFGWANRDPELVWPESSAGGRLSFASVPYSGGGEAQLSFARGATRYAVYSRVYRTNFTPGETNDPAFEDGVAVLHNGKQVADFPCDQSAIKPVDVALARKLATEADDAFVELDFAYD